MSKTFLFIGFSFTDPNLDYVLSRLHVSLRRTHYCFMRKEQAEPGDSAETIAYKLRKQELRIQDLKRFGIQTLLIDGYEEIPAILQEVDTRFRKKTIFISGSAEEFGDWSRQDGLTLLHSLAAALIKADLRIVNGFGWGVGSAVLNGALETIYANPSRYGEDQLASSSSSIR